MTILFKIETLISSIISLFGLILISSTYVGRQKRAWHWACGSTIFKAWGKKAANEPKEELSVRQEETQETVTSWKAITGKSVSEVLIWIECDWDADNYWTQVKLVLGDLNKKIFSEWHRQRIDCTEE